MKTTTNQQQIETNRKDPTLFNILYVDEDDINIRVFNDSYHKEYNLFSAQSGTRALEIIMENNIHVLISSYKVQGTNGIDLLHQVLSQKPEIIRVLTGDVDLETLIRAVNQVKIDKYIPAHWDADNVKRLIDEELQKFRTIDDYHLVELPRISFQSRIGKEEMETGGETDCHVSRIFPKSFEIINYPEESQSNFQWVGNTEQGHKVVILLNTILHPSQDFHIKHDLSEHIQTIVNEYNSCNQQIINKVSACYREIVSKYNLSIDEDFDISICALFIHHKNDTLQYFSNYPGLKLFDLHLNEYEDGMYSGFYRMSSVSRIFVFSSSFNAHCLGELTYSQLINESIEMDLDRQGHFLEMEVINSHLTTFNVSIIGIELNKYPHQSAS